MISRRARRGAMTLAIAALLAACSGPTPNPSTGATFDPAALQTCRQAFEVWVEGSRPRVVEPGSDILGGVVAMERVQRRLFELCTLAEAEALNQELEVEDPPGHRRPLIEPDMRTFAEVECVDESPLFDGTALCNEVLP
jgi:hypothetical protein